MTVASHAAPAALAAEPGALDPLSPLQPAVAEWFRRRFPDGPTEPQRQGWPLIASGAHTLIAAPTGSGKTLAGFLTAIDRLYARHAAGEDVQGTTQVVYVSPLRALAVDIAENLERPLAEIAVVAAELGLGAPDLRVAVRTGDTPSAQRAAMVRRPPNFVITTPESLYLLVTAASGREMLSGVETVIVDEIHAVARDKRGAHLVLTIERLEALCDAAPQRVGLSATQRPIETIADLLVGDRPAPRIVDEGHQRELDLALELPDGELEAVISAEQMGGVLDGIAALVSQHRTTLVFVNTRRLAERVAHQLAERLGDDAVAAHHGSLSKERRHRVETRLRAGDLRALVATASLELGIDIGPVELVCQIGSPRSIAAFLQRVGRSNHGRGGIPKGRLYPLTRDELVECAALLAAVRSGRLDAVHPPVAPLDILAQQMVAEVAAREWRTDELFHLMRRSSVYRNLSRADFDTVLELTSDGVTTGRGRRAAYLHHDALNQEVRARRGARLAALTSGGAIPETGDYRVVAEPDDTFIGTVNEDWAVESMAGDVFLLGTHSWQIRRVEPGVVRVRDAAGAPPTVPFWLGEAPARTAELSEAVSELRGRVAEHLAAGDPDGARRSLRAAAGVDDVAAATIVDYLAAARAALGTVPTQHDVVVERFFDETDGMQLVVHAPFGGRVNRALGLALRKRMCRTFDFELQAAATDDAVVLSLGPQHSFPLGDVLAGSTKGGFLRSHSVEDLLRHAVLDSPMFAARWRWNLNRALVVLRFRQGRRNPPPIQRMEADDVMAAVFPAAAACQENVTGPIDIPDHVLVRQTMHDTLHEALDVDGLRTLLTRIETGEVRVHARETTEPSVLSHEIITARPYAFLDDEELQNRRTQAVALRRGIPVDLTTIGALDPEAVDRVHAEVAPDPETPDELADLLAALVCIRARPEWQALFAELGGRGRVRTITSDDGNVWWCATESAEVAERARAGDDDAVATVLRGHLDVVGITTIADLSAHTGLADARVAAGLSRLEAQGFALRGSYVDPETGRRSGALAGGPGARSEVDPASWCARRLLARMHAYSRRHRRAQVEPATAQDFMRFVLRWQHLVPGTQLAGAEGLLDVVEALQGYEAPAAVWEPELLARRVREYRPELLDRLCHEGEVSWLRLTPRANDAPDRSGAPSKVTPIAMVLRDDFGWLLEAARGPGSPAEPTVGAVAEVVAALGARGASFASELVVETRRLGTDVERALWDGVARGLITADGFGAIRSRVSSVRTARARPLSRVRRKAHADRGAAGRWSLVARPEVSQDPDELAEAVAEQLLRRWGVVFRDLAVHDTLRFSWRDTQRALRRLEDRGLVLGGRFVTGFAGEQYALPEAAEQLSLVRRTERRGERVVVSASDPCNLTGVIGPGLVVPARSGRSVTYVDGEVSTVQALVG